MNIGIFFFLPLFIIFKLFKILAKYAHFSIPTPIIICKR